MFIRRTRTRSSAEHYFTFRLVRSERIVAKVRQRTLLNLGRHFDVARRDWPVLCRRIDDILAGQLPLPPDCPGVYCLRSSETDWDEATLWRTYFTLTDLEAVFRSLKSELGLRPIYHHKPIRAGGHLFITVIAYQLVQVIRTRLRQAGENASWTTLRRILEGQQRITATFRRADGRTLHVRKATRAEPPQQAIYDALGIGSMGGDPQDARVDGPQIRTCSATCRFCPS